MRLWERQLGSARSTFFSGSVAQWLSGSVAQWLSGSVAQWPSGPVTGGPDFGEDPHWTGTVEQPGRSAAAGRLSNRPVARPCGAAFLGALALSTEPDRSSAVGGGGAAIDSKGPFGSRGTARS
ncbi:hypothetical protein GCM10010340_12810 [Streptomyces griseoloalbus]|nr:hypothetical protein GCM10010340_12810 [Streptomyces albaduncus]